MRSTRLRRYAGEMPESTKLTWLVVAPWLYRGLQIVEVRRPESSLPGH